MSDPKQGASPMEGGGVGGGGAVPIPSSIPPDIANAPMNQTLLEAKTAAASRSYYLDTLNRIKNSEHWKGKASNEDKKILDDARNQAEAHSNGALSNEPPAHPADGNLDCGADTDAEMEDGTHSDSNPWVHVPPEGVDIQQLNVADWPVFDKLCRILGNEHLAKKYKEVFLDEDLEKGGLLSSFNAMTPNVIGGGAAESSIHLDLVQTLVAHQESSDENGGPLNQQPIPLQDLLFAFRDLPGMEPEDFWTNLDTEVFKCQLVERLQPMWEGKRKLVTAVLISYLGNQEHVQEPHIDATNPLQQHILALEEGTKLPVVYQYSTSVKPPPDSIVESIQYLREWKMEEDVCNHLANLLKVSLKERDDHDLGSSEMGCLLHNFKEDPKIHSKGVTLNPGQVATMRTMNVHNGPHVEKGEVRHVIFLVSAPIDSLETYNYDVQHTGLTLLAQIISQVFPKLDPDEDEMTKKTRVAVLTVFVTMMSKLNDLQQEYDRYDHVYFQDNMVTCELARNLFKKGGDKAQLKKNLINQDGSVNKNIINTNKYIFG